MNLHLKERYYKNTKIGREPIKFRVRQPRGIGTDVYGTIWIDPVLKDSKNSDLRGTLIKHETDEIKTWGQGQKASHTRAKNQEPALIRELGGVSGFWKEIKRRQGQTIGRRTFPTWRAMHEFAKQKRAEGYEVEGCGGVSTAKSHQYTVIFKKDGDHKKQEEPRLHAYVNETPDHIVARMKKEHRKPLRSIKAITDLAAVGLRRIGITGVKVLVKKVPVGGSHMDAAVRYTQVGGVNKPDQLIIHPMHQYTSDDVLDRKIRHEIDHLKATEKIKDKPHVEIIPTKLRRQRFRGVDTPSRGRIVPGVAYADKGAKRLARRHHKGWKRVKFT